ncbi:unnamed protein product [Brachionus calyciflorus]|uniref:Transposase n=1 Tax=Brachionus calyciflorus TaxID=104777 RepID=A0A814P8Y3_9BILA|nr:unnamed protein product [Brachionus calyciflorus]
MPKASSLKPRAVKTLNIWGATSYHGTTEFVIFTNTLNQDCYRIMVNQYFSQFLRNYPGGCRPIQDNAPPHTAQASVAL